MMREVPPTPGIKPPLIVERIEFGKPGIQERIPIFSNKIEERLYLLEKRVEGQGEQIARMMTIIKDLEENQK